MKYSDDIHNYIVEKNRYTGNIFNPRRPFSLKEWRHLIVSGTGPNLTNPCILVIISYIELASHSVAETVIARKYRETS